MALNPATQYADDRNLRARQRLWEHQQPRFDIVGWVLDLAKVEPGQRVLDVGCGNGAYLGRLQDRGVDPVGTDRSFGMLSAAAPHPLLVNGDITRLPFADNAFDVVLAPHMLYHVEDRTAAAHELRRALHPDGVCVVITNGASHMRSMRNLVEAAARVATPAWQMRDPSTHAFSIENGAAQLAPAFDSVDLVQPQPVPVVTVRVATIVADYVASVADLYEHEIARPWSEVVDHARREVQLMIDAEGAFTVAGDTGAFVCR